MKENISFAKISKDTVFSLKNAPRLLKELQPRMKSTGEWKLSAKRKEVKDKNGYTHRFYSQYHKGVRVEGGDFGVHASNDSIELVLGNFEPVGDVDVEAQLSKQEALQFALNYIGAETYKWQIPEEEAWIKEYYNDTYYPQGELVIAKDQLQTDSIYRLTYRFDIYAHQPLSRNYVWVDAITGDVINIESRIHFSNATGTAATRYSGMRTITTDYYYIHYRLRETRNGVNISTFNMNHTGSYTSTDFTDYNNNWTAAEFHNINKDDAALDAHWGAEMVYDYFRQVHNRDSWNNNKGPLLSYVNGNMPQVNPKYTSSDNAGWDGNKMTYGQGTNLSPFTTLDICAHEISHGICQTTAALENKKEAGAINESLSDIWGACLENYVNTTYGLNKDVWLHGEETGMASRSFSDPKSHDQPNTYKGEWWQRVDGCVPGDTNDNCGIHRNSGVGNHWFYLLSQGGSGRNDLRNDYYVTGIGIDKAAKIVYKAETSYLMPSADYAQFRNATILAATDYYGAKSQVVASVTNAWHAVGVGDRHPPIILGPSSVYPSTCEATFTLAEDLPVFMAHNIQWTVSPSIYQSCLTANGTSVTFNKPAGVFTGENYLTVTLTCSFQTFSQSYSTSKNFTLYPRIGGSLPSMSVYDGSTQVTSGAAGITSYTLKATENSYLSYYWEVFGPTGGSPILSTSVQSPTIRFPDAGSYAIRLSFRDICGRTLSPPHTTFSFTAIQPFTVYPNPVSSGTPLHLGLKDPSQPLTPSSARYAIMSISTGGLIVYPTTFDTNTGCDININSLPAGLYRLIVIYNGADYGVTFQKY